MGSAITVAGVTRRFGSIVALDSVSFSVERGEVVGLLGHNGAGKTTTIRILNGLLRPDVGAVRVLDFDPTTDGHKIRARTGVLTETPSLDERLTARENLAFFAQLFAVEPTRIASRVDELLDRFELRERAGDRVGGFSRGMKQRLALARSLLHDPELLCLDEPTAALDPVAARGVHELIRAFATNPQRTVVISTHNLVEAQRLCDRVLILRDGELVASGTPAELARRLGQRARVEIEIEPSQREAATAAIVAAGGGPTDVDTDTIVLDGIAREALPRLIAGLVNAGVDIYRVSPAEPSLEDAYFVLYEADAPARPEPPSE